MYKYFEYDNIPAVVLMSTAPPIVAATMFDGENWIPASPASLMHNAEILNEAEWRTRFAKVLENAPAFESTSEEDYGAAAESFLRRIKSPNNPTPSRPRVDGSGTCTTPPWMSITAENQMVSPGSVCFSAEQL